MHTATRSAAKCWLILLWTAWRSSFEGIQYARSIEEIKHARVLVSYISTRLVRTFSLRCFPFFFLHNVFHILYKLKEKGSLRCSFYFHVENHRATADASNERSLSASRDIRSIRIAITIQSQQHQRESLLMVSLFRGNCRIVSLRWYHIYVYFFAVPAPALLFRAISLCTISVFIPIENPHLTIVHFGKTLRVYSTSH